ncbi:GcrA cell cycle regulator [Methylobacterium sp. 4-46]|uniref:GcrA family cell cycle regulator n=1 Tax=unclassified Methylobacterium TaxID=2615210 RepID=UPI000152D3C2|nr:MULTISPECIES: GcrA family cell cycle regulator [Methylobacterium]ACA20935.1 GcrA cell cycle regulator [Methylobacterium sp. 4-46]WFT80090.1 GcrA family cell cycle regulator [Methylobacterium nodulans]
MTDAGPSWTKERVELLKRLWGEGRSASQIAAEIGGVSRNAVIGKVHRLGLAGRVLKSNGAPAPVPRSRAPSEEERPPAQAPVPTMVAPAPASLALVRAEPPPSAEAALPLSERVTIMELREFMCRWPMGDPASPDFRFCGARSITGLPYCTHHARIAYQPATERKRSDRRVVAFR